MNQFFNKFKFPRFLKQYQNKSLEVHYSHQETERYWYWRQRWHRIKLWVAIKFFELQQWQNNQQSNFFIFRTLLRAILPQVLLAFILVIGLEILEGVVKQIPSPLISSTFSKINLDFDAFGGLVLELVGLTGAFLALYFTAITVVASTVYADVTDDVRQLLVKEKFGNLYFRTVALFSVILVLAAGILIIKGELGVFNLALIILLASFSILSFVILGIKTLEFFNPTPLLNYLDRDFLKWAKAAIPNKTMWHDSSFQHHHQQQAENVLHTYKNVMTLISNRKGIGAKPIKNTTARALNLLQNYAILKPQYPTESRWFRQKGEFQNWLFTDASTVGIAISTGTGLQQKAIPDPMWVENELQEVVAQGLGFLLENHEWELTTQNLNKWQETMLYMSFHWNIQEATQLCFNVHELICVSVIQPDEQYIQPNNDYEELGQRLGVLDFSHLAFIQIIIGLARKLESISAKTFGEKINALDWERKNSIYRMGLPRESIKKLEQLQEVLALELAVEGKVVTPIWYIQQLIAAEFSTYIVLTIENFIDDIEKLFVEEAERLILDKSFIFASQTCRRGVEAVAKGEWCVSAAKQYLDGLSMYQQVFDFNLINTKWPDNKWDTMFARLLKTKQNLLVSWGKTVPVLSEIPPTENLPDMFGHVFNVLGNECMNALLIKNEELFSQLFKSFFIASQLSMNHNQTLLQGYEDWYKNKFIIDPIIDIMEISGYALVYTELQDGDFWQPVKQLWDWFFFEDLDKKQMRIESITTIAQIKSDVFLSETPRNLIRINWKQAFGKDMRSRGIKDDLSNTHFGGSSKLANFSPVVQYIIGHSGMPSDKLYRLFLAIYFDKASNTPELILPDRIQSIQRYIKQLEEGSKDKIA